jgi:hypothetical protein
MSNKENDAINEQREEFLTEAIDRKLLAGERLSANEALYQIYHVLEEWSDGQDWANECQQIALDVLTRKNIHV